MILPDTLKDLPNGILIYLDNEGDWVMSINRVISKEINEQEYAEMISEAKNFLRAAREMGHDVVDAEDDEAIVERLPKVGDSVPQMQSVNRVLDGGLEEAASILPHLWEWVVGIADKPWEPHES